MPKRRTSSKRTLESAFDGLSLISVDESFSSAEQLSRCLDSFLDFLQKNYLKKNMQNHNVANILGFILQRLFVRKDPTVEEVQVICDFMLGTATIYAPSVKGETVEQWERRRNELLAALLPTLPDAQVRATVQLYRTLSLAARRELASQYSPPSPKGQS